jgi:hypothetical protein
MGRMPTAAASTPMAHFWSTSLTAACAMRRVTFNCRWMRRHARCVQPPLSVQRSPRPLASLQWHGRLVAEQCLETRVVFACHTTRVLQPSRAGQGMYWWVMPRRDVKSVPLAIDVAWISTFPRRKAKPRAKPVASSDSRIVWPRKVGSARMCVPNRYMRGVMPALREVSKYFKLHFLFS